MAIYQEALRFAQRYGPTLVAHLLFFLWLGLLVVDRHALPNGTTIWTHFAAETDGAFKAIGLSLDRWYVVLALLVAYLTSFEWLRTIVASIPGLRIVTRSQYSPTVLAEACATLGLEPEPWTVARALNTTVKRAREQVRQKGERDPYQWQYEREAVLRAYHGTVLVGFLATLAWLISGARYAGSGDLVWLTAALLVLIAIGLAWSVKRLNQRTFNSTGFWALSQLERQGSPGEDEGFRYARRAIMQKRALQEIAIQRHPATRLYSLFSRFPLSWSEGVRMRINLPRREGSEEWQLFASSRRRAADDPPVQAEALDTTAFKDRYRPLLERKGTGAFILVPRTSGLALGAGNEGSGYSFVTREHGGHDFALRLEGDSLRPKAKPRLRLQIGDWSGFLAPAGTFPLERLLLGMHPGQQDGWDSLFWGNSEDPYFKGWSGPDKKTVEDVTVTLEAPLVPGASFLAGIKTPAGMSALVAFQCFRIGQEERLLVTWGFLWVREGAVEPRQILPWWNPGAWRGLIRPKKQSA